MKLSKLTLGPHPKRLMYHEEPGMTATEHGVLIEGGSVLIPWHSIIEATIEVESDNVSGSREKTPVRRVRQKEASEEPDRLQKPSVRAAARVRNRSK